MSVTATHRDIRELARLRGIQQSYLGGDQKRVRASVETLVGVLAALGHPIADAGSLAAELDRARAEKARVGLEPVIVRRPDRTLSAPLPPGSGQAVVDGAPLDLATAEIEPGYHRLAVTGLSGSQEALLLVPPGKLPAPRQLAVNAPTYALRGGSDWGVGSYADLASFADLASSWGADLAGTLPLFALFSRPPIDPSPYLPVSRSFWNELYVDVPAAAALAGSAAARDAASDCRPRAPLATAPTVDYEAVASAKREALEVCAQSIAAGAARDGFEAFVAGHPELVRYADFRAADERIGSGWRGWPSRPGVIPEGAVDRDAASYHRFVQYAATVQLEHVAKRGAAGGAGLYLDLPVGVHPDGFDTWANAELFADAQVGAPPDPFFEGGQAWGFPPLHPERLRRSGYAYFIAALREVLRFARAVRIDHILGLQRLYWIPDGADARTGAYVRYRHEELLAIVAIEAHRAGACVVGEDLGTVSPDIRHAMDRTGVLHSFVQRFEATADHPLPQPRRAAAASVGSHDLPRFATYWREPEQRELVAAVGVHDPERALAICLDSLAAGPAAIVVVDVADLDGETEPDNRPGTGPEAGNWRHRLRRSIDDLAADPGLRQLMTGLTQARNPVTEEARDR